MLKRRGGCSQGFADAKPTSYMLYDSALKKGGCSQNFADAKPSNYMLIDSALKTGGAKKRSSRTATKKRTSSRRRYGGEETTATPAATTATTATPPPASAPAPAPQPSMNLMDTLKSPATTLGLGSAFSGFLPSKGGGLKNNKQKKGGTGVELAPFISSLVLLGLRIGTDKGLQESVTKNLSSMVSRKDKLSSRKTTSKKTTQKKTASKKTSMRSINAKY